MFNKQLFSDESIITSKATTNSPLDKAHSKMDDDTVIPNSATASITPELSEEHTNSRPTDYDSEIEEEDFLYWDMEVEEPENKTYPIYRPDPAPLWELSTMPHTNLPRNSRECLFSYIFPPMFQTVNVSEKRSILAKKRSRSPGDTPPPKKPRIDSSNEQAEPELVVKNLCIDSSTEQTEPELAVSSEALPEAPIAATATITPNVKFWTSRTIK